jgi:hypothetical protein
MNVLSCNEELMEYEDSNCIRNCNAILAHCFDRYGYQTYWQKSRINFIIFQAFPVVSGVGNRKTTTLQNMMRASLHIINKSLYCYWKK